MEIDVEELTSFISVMEEELEVFEGDIYELIENLEPEYDCELEYLSKTDYGEYYEGELDYVYPNKTKARVACKESLERAVNDAISLCNDSIEEAWELVESFSGRVEENCMDFIGEWTSLWDDNASLETTGDTEMYLVEKKQSFFGSDTLSKTIQKLQVKKNDKRSDLEKKVKNSFDLKSYFKDCDYDYDEDGSYAYDIGDGIYGINSDLDELESPISQLCYEVYTIYRTGIKEWIKGIHDALHAVVNVE